MRIEYVRGDLLRTRESHVVQGCNSRGVMGSGLAAAIRAVWPEVYAVYRAAYEEALRRGEPHLPLGDVIPVAVEGGSRTVLNAITQKDFGRDKRIVYVDYGAVRTAMRRINADLAALGVPSVGLPLIGAGLANGDWSIIAAVIEAELVDVVPVVHVPDGIVPGVGRIG